jgi:catechol 2,3-dioxygenase-like lactoylglutathione lyase family enzyme
MTHTPSLDPTATSACAESRRPPHVQRLDRPAALVKARSLAFLIFDKPDLPRMQAFLCDFGMQPASASASQLVMRGAGSAPCIYLARRAARSRYVGAAFEVGADVDLRRLALATGARALEPSQIPGGGRGIVLRDPAGHEVWLIAGQGPLPTAPSASVPASTNFPDTKQRIDDVVRPPAIPAQVFKAGHVVLRTARFDEMAAWYMRHLGLVPTDVQYLEDGSPNLVFLRFDLADTPADHHAVVVAGGLDNGFEHAAYEVRDLDSLGQGQQVLRRRGHRHLWGIGRHVIGSQLFDYWFDPDGEALEHYADGDVFTSTYETRYSPLNLAGLYAWGADLPPAMKPARNAATLINALRLLRSKRLSLARLKLLGKAFGAPARPWL